MICKKIYPTFLSSDRKKNLFKLSQGEFVSPEKLEGKFRESDWVDQIFVHGDREKSLLIAVVYIRKYMLSKYLNDNNFEAERFIWTSDDALKKNVLKSICEIGLKENVRFFLIQFFVESFIIEIFILLYFVFSVIIISI